MPKAGEGKGPRARTRKMRKENQRRGAACLTAFVSNIFASYVPPIWGVVLAIAAIVLYLYSFIPVEIWIKSHFRSKPVVSVICSLGIFAVIAFSVLQGGHAWKKHNQAKEIASHQSNPCPAGQFVMSDIQTEVAGETASNPNVHTTGVLVKGKHPCTQITGVHNKNTSVGVDIETEGDNSK